MNIESILSWAVAVAALTAAIMVAIKTPKKHWFKQPANAEPNQAWAPEYSKQEKWRLLGKHSLWIMPLMIGMQWLSNGMSQKAFLCDQTWGLSHGRWILSGLLLLMFLIFTIGLVVQWFYWQKVRRQGQFPLPGQKVWKPIKIITGHAAQRRAALFMTLIFCLGMGFLVAVAGLYFAMQGLISADVLAAQCVGMSAA